ncbi:restriction endonuclease subunit S [Parageobacillus thermoglucosidasius]|uniref:Restriction endonuclease subunit S n=1 Tax=Parageobacillus thermoglucosidasius TaxID=1426 RepID=A0AB38R3U6_PARTM|nr:restriction endonuclease subunit S [Parageobacillus thermoglucosidasius]UOE77155.1 restriction endonuclease subunit S [Parageobacillus thermoglucosidasius]
MSKKKQKSMEELLEEALVPEEEQPYKVPENWVWVRSGHVAKWGSGGTPSRKRLEYYGGDIPWIKTGELNDGIVNASEETITEEGLQNSSAKIFPKGSIVIAMYGATIGKLGILGVDAATNQACAVGQPYDFLNSKYMFYYFLARRSDLIVLGKGGAQPNISQTIIKDFPFALPPLNEQKRIAEKVERLFAKLDEAKRLIEEVKGSFELRWESILDKAFRGELTKKWRSKNSMIEKGDDIFKEIQKVYKKSNKKDEHEINPPYQIPQNWRWVRLGDIVDINPPKKKLADIEDDQICTFIPMTSISDKTGEIENPEIREYAKVKKGYTFFLENDILFAKITPCMENGKTAIAQNLINGFGFGSTEFHVIRTNSYINTKLIYYLLRSKKFRMEAKKEMTGAVGQQRVPKSFLENYLFPLPTKREQDKIVELLDKLYAKEVEISKIEALEGEIDSLRQSILNKAFRGELGTNDPTDEHAIELLKEVLKSK